MLKSENGITLRINGEPAENETYNLILSAFKGGTNKLIEEISSIVPKADMAGNIALQSHFDIGQTALAGLPGFWFENDI